MIDKLTRIGDLCANCSSPKAEFITNLVAMVEAGDVPDEAALTAIFGVLSSIPEPNTLTRQILDIVKEA
jgi:hypothetical protein